ncbi:hypothetical protein K8R47_02890 [archaeon]|nr:hypothetical protein [archaeon]
MKKTNKEKNLFLKAIAIEFLLLAGTTLISGYFITKTFIDLSEIFQAGIIPGLLITAILTFIMVIPLDKK